MGTKGKPATGLGGRHQIIPEHQRNQVNKGCASDGNKNLPIRIPADVRAAIKKTHPLESAFLEYLLEQGDPRVVLVEEGT